VSIGVIGMGDGVGLLTGWSDPQVEAAMQFIRRRVLDDLVSAIDLPADEVLALRLGGGEVLATVFHGEHDFPVELHEGVEEACALVAGQVQDDVIGRLGRAWPEVHSPGGDAVGVLEPACEPIGLAHWALRGRPLCAVGQLTSAVAAAGLVIS
jgi:hypothetical protein